MHYKTLILLTVVLCILPACTILVIDGSGNIITQNRAVTDFNRIEFSAFGRLDITQGTDESLSVTIDDNLSQYIVTEVIDGTLYIRLTDDAISFGDGETSLIRPSRSIRYTLTVAALDSLAISGAGTVNMDGLATGALSVDVSGAGVVDIENLIADSLEVSMSGAGSVRISGQVDSQQITISGVGGYNGKDLLSRQAAVTISSAGGADVWVTETLDIAISGAGDVGYWGSPTLTRQVTGSGVITSHGDK